MVLDKLCKDNAICCDDNCQRCANLIYQKYIEQKTEIDRLQKSNRNWRRKVQRLRASVEKAVYCKDCQSFKHIQSDNLDCHICKTYGGIVKEKDYCSRYEEKHND